MSLMDPGMVRTAVQFAMKHQPPAKKAPRWREDDLNKIKALLPFHSPAVIGNMLGRSPDAIKIIRQRKKFKASSKSDGWFTANRVRVLLGMADARPVIGWIKKGFIAGHQITGEKTWMVNEISLRRWVASPLSWAYFDPSQIADKSLARLVGLSQARWGDEWLSTRQVADMKGTDTKAVVHAIKRRVLPAMHLTQKDGRSGATWAFWVVKRSDAEAWDPNPPAIDLMDEKHAFILLACAIGLSAQRIGIICGMSAEAVSQKLRKINTRRFSAKLIEKYHFKHVVFNPGLRGVHADWRRYAKRFPHLRRAFQRYKAGKATRDDLYLITRILKVQLVASGGKCNINTLGRITGEYIKSMVREMRRAGIKPYLPK